MSSSWFVFGELVAALRSRSVLCLGGVALVTAAFLVAFSGLFLLTEAEKTVGTLGPTGIAAHLSPLLSTRDVEALYLNVRGRPEVKTLSYLFGQEVGKKGGGILRIEGTGPDAAAKLAEALRSTQGVARVEGPGRQPSRGPALPSSTRLGLLISLASTLVLALIVARFAYGALLDDFAGEICLLRLSGVTEGTIQSPLILLGGMVGLIASLLVLAVLSLLHLWAVARPWAFGFVPGLADAGRVTAAILVAFPLGLLIGGLGGLLGASLTGLGKFRVRHHS